MAQRIEIVMDGHQKGSVKIDGVDVVGVYGLSFTAGVDQVNDLTLQIRAEHVTITGPAEVHRVREG